MAGWKYPDAQVHTTYTLSLKWVGAVVLKLCSGQSLKDTNNKGKLEVCFHRMYARVMALEHCTSYHHALSIYEVLFQ